MLKYNGDPCKEHGRSKIQTYFQSFYILCCECSKLCADCRANEHHSCCNQLDPSLHRITEGAIGPGDNNLKKVRDDPHPCRAADDIHSGWQTLTHRRDGILIKPPPTPRKPPRTPVKAETMRTTHMEI